MSSSVTFNSSSDFVFPQPLFLRWGGGLTESNDLFYRNVSDQVHMVTHEAGARGLSQWW